MWKKEIIQEEVIKNHKYCDVCNVEIKTGMACSAAHCKICHKDLCENCIQHEVATLGDYREVYCENCWTIGEEYRKLIKEHELEIERLEEEWNTKCKN